MCDIFEYEEMYSSQLIFVQLLKEYPEAISIVPVTEAVRTKETAIMLILRNYQNLLNKPITLKQFRKKIYNMKNWVKGKLEAKRSGKEVIWKSWEVEFLKLMKWDDDNYIPEEKKTLQHINSIKTEREDNGHDTDLGDNYINYDNSNDSNSQEPQTKKLRYSSCSSGFGPTNEDANEDEDEHTKQLTNNQLQRLVLLEQLRVAKLQGECAELKLRRLTHQSTTIAEPVKMNKSANSILTGSVSELDPELYEMIKNEKTRQRRGLELIASENFTSVSVLQCLSSCLHNKYSEGLPGQRYYGGNEFIDQVELLCQRRSLEAFNLDSEKWGCNVQPLSGSPANIEVYTALVGVHGRIMGLDLPDGGHLSHGFKTPTKKISVSSLFFESMPYKVDIKTGLIDYDKLADNAKLFNPNLIVAGISCYSRHLDYKKFREICDANNCYLMADMAHVSGLVAAGLSPSPFEYADVVTTTTHKTLRGPRAAVIFFRKGVRHEKAKGGHEMYDLEAKINQSVFPGFQGGPHNNSISAIATAMLQVKTDEYVEYQKQVVANAKKMADELMKKDYTIVTGGTDNHIVLVDLRNKKVTGARAEKLLEAVSIACNKNTVPGDKSAFNPSGIRLGTPALSTRGLKEHDMEVVIGFIDEAIRLAQEIGTKCGIKLVEFLTVMEEDKMIRQKIHDLKSKIEAFSEGFPLPGLDNI